MDHTMRRWHLGQFGKQHLQLQTVAILRPGPGQILVRVTAVALNYRDKMNIDNGTGGAQVQPPFTPASDMAGEVVAVGDGVQRFIAGQRVISTFWGGWLDGPWPQGTLALGAPGPGMLAEYVLLQEDWAVAAPLHLTDAQASTLPCAGLTAWTALVDTDWYPASYPWHAVIELDPGEKRVVIKEGEPLCRVAGSLWYLCAPTARAAVRDNLRHILRREPHRREWPCSGCCRRGA